MMSPAAKKSKEPSDPNPDLACSTAAAYSRFKLSSLIGTGSFGEIYLAYDKVSGKDVAIKAESTSAKNPQLEHEYYLYSKHLAGVEGFPEAFHLVKSNSHTYFTMTLLGPTLESLLDHSRNNHFSEKTVIMLAIQLLERLEAFHDNTQHAHR